MRTPSALKALPQGAQQGGAARAGRDVVQDAQQGDERIAAVARWVAADITPFEASLRHWEGAQGAGCFAQEGQTGVNGVVVERRAGGVGARPEAPEAAVAATDIEQALSAAQQGGQSLPAGPGLAARAREIGRVALVKGAVDGQEALGGIVLHHKSAGPAAVSR